MTIFNKRTVKIRDQAIALLYPLFIDLGVSIFRARRAFHVHVLVEYRITGNYLLGPDQV